MSTPRRFTLDDVMATSLLTALTVVTALGLSRVFTGWEYLRPVLIVALVVHLVCFLLRQVRLPGVVALVLAANFLPLAISGISSIKMLALGISFAIILDATVANAKHVSHASANAGITMDAKSANAKHAIHASSNASIIRDATHAIAKHDVQAISTSDRL